MTEPTKRLSTIAGYTFSSPRWGSDPQEVITELTSSYPNHTADAFYYPHLASLPPIARVTVQLQQLFYGVLLDCLLF